MSTPECSHVPQPIGSRRQRVLLIEDDQNIVRWVQRSFVKHDQYLLEYVEGVKDALSRLLQGGIDAILLDLGLPDCAEQFVYSSVREAAPGAPILIFSASTREEVDSSIVPQDVARFLLKGQISSTALVECVADALGTCGTTG
jgi:DNA-binding NtrC family response regulator